MWPAKLAARSDLTLRLLNHRHSAELFALVDAERGRLGKWLPWVDDTGGKEDISAFISKATLGVSHNTEVHYVICRTCSVIGVVGFAEINSEGVSVLGYWLSERHEGGGLMLDSCRCLIEEARRQGLTTIEIRCGAENIKSRAVAERLGFHVSRFIPNAECLRGASIDHVVYVKPCASGDTTGRIT